MTRWTWGWITSLVVLVGLLVTVPVSGVGSSGPGGAESSETVFGLIRRSGNSDALVRNYSLAMVAAALALAVFVCLDLRARKARRAAHA